jgi:hypothetical protein
MIRRPRSASPHAFAATLLLALSGAAAILAQEPSAPVPAPAADGTVALFFAPPLNRPLLVEGVVSGEMTLSASGGPADASRTIRFEQKVRFIDEHTRLEEGVEEGTRAFVEATSVENGEIADPPLNGLVVRYSLADGRKNLALEGSRLLPPDEMNGMLANFDSLGFWLHFPESTRVGDEFDLDLTPLAAWLMGEETIRGTGKAKVKLESFDAASGTAKLRGAARLDGELEMRGIAIAMVQEGEVRIETRGAESRIASLEMDATVTASGAPTEPPAAAASVRFQGKGKLTSRFATKLGPAVAAARSQKPRFRDRVHVVDSVGVSFALPSFYGVVEVEGMLFGARRLLGNEGDALLSATLIVAEGALDTEPFYRGLQASLEKQHGKVQSEKVSSPLGAGRAYRYTADLGEGEGGGKVLFRLEAFPKDGRVILLRLQGDAKGFAAALPELAKARKSLKRLPG